VSLLRFFHCAATQALVFSKSGAAGSIITGVGAKTLKPEAALLPRELKLRVRKPFRTGSPASNEAQKKGRLIGYK
jgi:hypothetical protein